MDKIESDISDGENRGGWKRKAMTKQRTRLLSSDSSSSENVKEDETTYTKNDTLCRNTELLADLTLEENSQKKIASRLSNSVEGEDELRKNGEIPADIMITKRRKRKRIRVLRNSSSSESVHDETEYRNDTFSERCFQKVSTTPTLEGLPDETLNRILAKAIIMKVLKQRPASSLIELGSKQVISRWRGRWRCVSSSWNNSLSSECFEDLLDATVNHLVPCVQSVALQLAAKFECSNVVAVTNLGRKVYVLRNDSFCSVQIYNDESSLADHSEVVFRHIRNPTDIVACKKTKVLYIGGRESECIWQIPVRNIKHYTDIRPWMEDVENLDTFSVTAEGQLVIPRNKPFDHIGVYDGNARLIHQIYLPMFCSYPGHVVQKSNGNIVLSHNMSFSLSELNSDGRFVHRYKFCSGERLLNFCGFLFNHFVLDSEERVIAVNVNGREIVCIDPTLRQAEVIATEETGIVWPTRVHYDKKNSKLIVVGLDSVGIFNVLNPVTCMESN